MRILAKDITRHSLQEPAIRDQTSHDTSDSQSCLFRVSGIIGTYVILERHVLKILYAYTIGGTNVEIQYMTSVLSVIHVR